MEAAATLAKLGLTDTDFTSIDEYRKKKNTAVLTIMFTDIEGFTALSEARGEAFVHGLKEEHNRILVEAIEADSAGVVIKFIGDSVMAVFSEPTAAVDRALEIQDRLRDFNTGHPELPDLKVRIGLHLGQTVIENQVRPDLFGRQVNKASRVEALAAGGQIYLSYTVFDSIKSWLTDSPEFASVSHGRYFLKGIPKAEEIFEVYRAGTVRPRPPKNARKERPVPALLAWSAAAAALACAGVLLFSVFAKPEVYFTGMNAREPVVDFVTPLAVTEVAGSTNLKKSLTDLQPGPHILHYVVSPFVRYFAPVEVKSGKNIIPVAFKESYLPNVETNYYWGEKAKPAPPVLRSDEQTYFFFDRKTKARTEMTGTVTAGIRGVSLDQKKAVFEIHWTLALNHKTVAEKTVTVENPLGQTDRVKGPDLVVYSDSCHAYHVRYSCYDNSIQVDVEGNFQD